MLWRHYEFFPRMSALPNEDCVYSRFVGLLFLRWNCLRILECIYQESYVLLPSPLMCTPFPFFARWGWPLSIYLSMSPVLWPAIILNRCLLPNRNRPGAFPIKKYSTLRWSLTAIPHTERSRDDLDTRFAPGRPFSILSPPLGRYIARFWTVRTGLNSALKLVPVSKNLDCVLSLVLQSLVLKLAGVQGTLNGSPT